MGQSKVSVIIPVYNAEEHLHECLDSVVNQTLADIEIICIDDGSTDESPTILREYEAKDNRVRVLTQSNCGAGPARNAGIASATGEYISFMDADDYYPEDATLSKLYHAAKEHMVVICGGSYSTFRSDGRVFEHSNGGFAFPADGEMRYEDYQFDYGYQRFIYQRQFLVDNNISFPPYLRFQDPPFFVRAMIAADRFYAIHDITYRYRWDKPRDITSNERKIRDSIYGYTDVLKLAKDHDLHRLYKLSIDRCCTNNWRVLRAAEKSQDPETREALREFSKMIDLPLRIGNESPFWKLRYVRDQKQHMKMLALTFHRIGKAITRLPRRALGALRRLRRHAASHAGR